MSGGNRAAYLLLGVAAATWGGNFVAGRYVHAEVSPLALSLSRWSLALLLIAPFTAAAVRRQWPVVRRHWRLLAVLGITGVGLFHYLVYVALQSTGAINASLILSLTPVAIIPLSWLLHRERVSALQALGIAGSLAGAVVVVVRGDAGILAGLELNRGDVAMLVATMLWGLYNVLMRRRPQELEPMVLLTVTVVFGMAGLAPVAAWEILRGSLRFEPTPAALGAVVYVALFASVLAYVCWNRGVAAVGANRAGPAMHLVPLFSAALAVGLLGERVELYHLIGAALIFGGLYVAAARATNPD